MAAGKSFSVYPAFLPTVVLLLLPYYLVVTESRNDPTIETPGCNLQTISDAEGKFMDFNMTIPE